MRNFRAPPDPLTSSLTSKGQVTIPAPVRRLLGIVPRDKIEFLVTGSDVRIAPATSVAARTAGVLRSQVSALTPQEEKAAVEHAIAGEAERRS